MRTRKQAAFALPSLLLAMAFFVPTAFAEVVKARKEGVRLFAEASGSAKVLRTLKKDELINMRHRFGSFLAVDAGVGVIGYVRALDTVKVADKEAEAFRKELEGKVGKVDAGEASSARARTSSSVMGVRGLADDADAASRANARPDMRHVRVMEERVPSSMRLDSFETAVFEEIEKLEQAQPPAAVPASIASGAPETGAPVTPSAPPNLEQAAALLIERQSETELGRGMAGRLLALTPPLRDATVSGYVGDVGAYVARAAGTPDRTYAFEVLASDAVNAFACPGGFIFVTSGALRQVESEAELAAILAHEIIHVKERHILQALRGRDFAEEKKQAAGRGPDTILSARKRPEGASSEVGSFLSKQLLGPQAAGISLLQTLDASMGILMSKGLDAKLEYEADGQGAALAATAGYDGAALGRYFARLRSRTPGAPSAAVEKTHPTFLDRERTLVTFLRGNAALATTGASGAERFLRVRKRLVALKVPVK